MLATLLNFYRKGLDLNKLLSSVSSFLSPLRLATAMSPSKRGNVIPSRRSNANLSKLYRILFNALAAHGFPTFCGVLVGAATLLEHILATALNCVAPLVERSCSRNCHRAWSTSIRFSSTLISAWMCLPLLQVPEKSGSASSKSQSVETELHSSCASNNGGRTSVSAVGRSMLDRAPIAGRTIDLSTCPSSMSPGPWRNPEHCLTVVQTRFPA